MRIFRRLELTSALAGVLVGVLGVIFILYATTANYTYGSGTGDTVHGVHGTIPAIQDPHLAPALIRIAVVETVLLGLMLLGAVMHVRTRHVGWGLTLLITAIVLAVYNLLVSISFGYIFLLVGVFAVLAALFAFIGRTANQA